MQAFVYLYSNSVNSLPFHTIFSGHPARPLNSFNAPVPFPPVLPDRSSLHPQGEELMLKGPAGQRGLAPTVPPLVSLCGG